MILAFVNENDLWYLCANDYHTSTLRYDSIITYYEGLRCVIRMTLEGSLWNTIVLYSLCRVLAVTTNSGRDPSRIWARDAKRNVTDSPVSGQWSLGSLSTALSVCHCLFIVVELARIPSAPLFVFLNLWLGEFNGHIQDYLTTINHGWGWCVYHFAN